MTYLTPRRIFSLLLTLLFLLGLTQALSKPALADDCTWDSRPGLSDSTQTVTVAQIAFDLCYVAGQLYQRNAPASGWTGQATPAEIMQQMEGIVAETNFLIICQTQATGNSDDDQTNADHALPDHPYTSHGTPNTIFKGFGCGPYYKYYGIRNDIAPTFKKPTCDTTRLSPIRATGHPPTTREITAFDLCHASTKINKPTTIPPDLRAYIINLMVEVNLALTCANGRPADDVDGKTFSIPAPTDSDYVSTRRLGCPPYIPTKR